MYLIIRYNLLENDQTNSIEMTELQPSGSDIVDDQGSDKPRGQNTTNSAFETLRRLFRCKHQGLDILVSHFFYIKFYDR